ncbi:MAG: HEAT repeat domain-containing protein [Myxococcaceae bacterium]|nr:HEAT repeat domain-containing protein [Myxococcaceae bacterium]
MTCLTCGALQDFGEDRSDSEASTRPSGFDRLERLGTTFDWTDAFRCPACSSIFEWYRDRDSDTGITSETITRCGDERAISVLCAALAWPWPIDKHPGLLEELGARLTTTVDELRATDPWKPAHLARLELLGEQAKALAPRLAAFVEDELGARALAAMGAFDVLDASAKRGHRPALRALARSGPAAFEPTLVAALQRTGNTLSSAEAAHGLGRLGLGREILAEVLRVAQDTHVTNACRSALAAIGALDELLAALADRDWSVQRAAAEGLGMSTATPAVLEALRGAVTGAGRQLIVRTTAFRSLQALGVERSTLQALIAQLEGDADPTARRAAKSCAEELR